MVLLGSIVLAPCNGLHGKHLASIPSIFQYTKMTTLHMTNINNEAFVRPPPYLAVITEPDACATDERAQMTFSAIAKAAETTHMDLVSIRLDKPAEDELPKVYERALELTKRLVQLADDKNNSSPQQSRTSVPGFRVVCSSDWVELAMEANAHGIHIKESHLAKIPAIRQIASTRDSFMIGTSAHSVQSAVESYVTYRPDYYFVGTCFLTASHPEKDSADLLEGPTLPGEVQKALLLEDRRKAEIASCPAIFAIGGIDESNCHIPVTHGADGVAVIRAVLRALDPADATASIHEKMESALKVAGDRSS